ncbi:uncharacterized protein EAF01_006878 [Botrytis porri]|uniref:TM7S3/TM198-like domain-containing protein n=1 Tax=Botrytis porri TaxID=87229 RepID=A0A4Z1KUC7_9HELO|nr:uncharacterized protein EAF01_006878 [Botrytis porri]KAF7901579.1 hypothetical protein EAF01_006878 [Botrytis porri]TGO88124.1 hypothetical protein BPOR_0182g00050 [Botrytis porri]
MQIKGSVLLVLGASIQWVFAAPWNVRVQERDNSVALSSKITSTSSSISSSAKEPQESNDSFTSASTITHSQSTSLTSTTSTSNTAMLTSTASASSISATATSISATDSAFNSTISSGELPLQPEITPAFAIAGIILIATGIIYTFIGIKNRWLHISLSVGYLVSIAITVLILFVMNLPVSNAVEGAYLVAIVLPGLIIGGCSLIFTEVTEGLGCLLGGFCFSMWLLVMKAGGLITSTAGKSILIAAISIAAFSLSFSHHTRTYGLVACISFAGSTAIVLGIDCFSRAGLKEFWAYIWNLNQNLFPLGATTYPVTKGIRVEIAAIFVIFLAGLVSQSKVHKMIQDHRAQKLEERQEIARVLEEEEMSVGRRVEDQNIAEKERWEKVYGEKVKSGDESTHDSVAGDLEDSKRRHSSTITSIMELDGTEVEISEKYLPTRSNVTGLVTFSGKGHDGAVTVRVARDATPDSERTEDKVVIPSRQSSQKSGRSQLSANITEGKAVVVDNESTHLANLPSLRPTSKAPPPPMTVAPEVVPLPFKIPEDEMQDNQSSIASIPDEELAVNGTTLKRTSSGSKRDSQRYSEEQGISTDDSTTPYADETDRASSIAATVDDLSDDEDRDIESIRSSVISQGTPLPDVDFPAQGDQNEEQGPELVTVKVTTESEETASGHIPLSPMDSTTEDADNKVASGTSDVQQSSELRPESGITVATNILNTPRNEISPNESMPQQDSLTTCGDPVPNTSNSTVGESLEDADNGTESKLKTESSMTSAPDTKTTKITKDQLPAKFSKVVMSYRTNEWAKHLSHADSPELEELDISESTSEDLESESAVPVDVEALQQTAHNALPPPAIRSSSQQSISPGLIRSSSTQSNMTPFATIPEGSTIHGQDSSTRNSSQQPLGGYEVQRSFRNASNPSIPEQIVESPGEEIQSSQQHFSQSMSPAFGNSNTLMKKRDTMLRNRSSYFPTRNFSTHSMPILEPNPQSPSRFQSASHSQMGSETGSIHSPLRSYHVNKSTPILPEHDDIPLSQRRELIRRSTTQPLAAPNTNLNSHQPKRTSAIQTPLVREQQLAMWRNSIANDLQVQKKREMDTVDNRRSVLWQERRTVEMRKEGERRARELREERWEGKIRTAGGEMEELHRKMMSRMQDEARKVL